MTDYLGNTVCRGSFNFLQFSKKLAANSSELESPRTWITPRAKVYKKNIIKAPVMLKFRENS
jgi:hypothetical protein